MGIFGSVWNAVSKPVRGLGRIARGKFKEGLSDIGSGAKSAAPFLAATGVGAPLAIGIGAGGGALEGATREGGGFTDALTGAAKGAATTGAAAGLRGIGKRILGGGEAVNPFEAAASGAPSTAGVAAPAAASAASGGAGGGVRGIGRLARAGRGVVDWVGDNPEVASQIAGTAANAYGAHQEGAALDRIANLREEEMRRGWRRQENADPVIQDIIRRLLVAQSPN